MNPIFKKGQQSIKQMLDNLADSGLAFIGKGTFIDSKGNIFIEKARDSGSQVGNSGREVRDSGGSIMSVNDVAALLQKSPSAVREMCKTKAQRGPHPLPFTKVGKLLRFERAKLMRWLETMPQRRRRR